MTTVAERTGEADMLGREDFQYAPVEAKLREWGLDYTINREFPIADIKFDAGAQVRFVENIAKKDRVEEYQRQMKNGAIFPPVVLQAAGSIMCDGNTRIAAAKGIGRQTFPVILVDTKTEDVARMLAASLNQMGGERLTGEEAHEAALTMFHARRPAETIARELGRDLGQVKRWQAEKEVLDRAHDMGLSEEVEKLKSGVLHSLSAVALAKPFQELLGLFADAQPMTSDAKKYVKKVNTAPSETDALAIISDLREELAPAGPPPSVATRPEIPLVRAAVAKLTGYADRPSAAFDPRKRDEELARWEKLEGAVGAVLTAIRSA